MLLPADRNKSLEYVGSYLSLEDILATSSRLPCRFQVTLPGLGPILAPGRFEVDIVSGTQLEIPLWLATALSASRRPTLRTSLPRQYSTTQKREFEAGASVVNLRRLGPYYYQVGIHLAHLPPALLHCEEETHADIDEEEVRAKRVKSGGSEDDHTPSSVVLLLETALRDRLQAVLDGSLHANREQTPTLVARLDELEEALFRAGQSRACELRRWHCRVGVGQLNCSIAAARLHQHTLTSSKKQSLPLT